MEFLRYRLLFGPQTDGFPVLAELRASGNTVSKRVVNNGDSDELFQIVRLTQLHFPLLRKLITLRSLRNARLQRALDSISR